MDYKKAIAEIIQRYDINIPVRFSVLEETYVQWGGLFNEAEYITFNEEEFGQEDTIFCDVIKDLYPLTETFPLFVFIVLHEIGHVKTLGSIGIKNYCKSQIKWRAKYRKEKSYIRTYEEEYSYKVGYRNINGERLADEWAITAMKEDRLFLKEILERWC